MAVKIDTAYRKHFVASGYTYKWNCHFSEIFDTGYGGICHFDNIRCNPAATKICQQNWSTVALCVSLKLSTCSLTAQAISSHNIACVGYMVQRLPPGRISTTCTISMSGNDRNCKCIFIFLKTIQNVQSVLTSVANITGANKSPSLLYFLFAGWRSIFPMFSSTTANQLAIEQQQRIIPAQLKRHFKYYIQNSSRIMICWT